MGSQCAVKEAQTRGLDRSDPLFMGGQHPLPRATIWGCGHGVDIRWISGGAAASVGAEYRPLRRSILQVVHHD